MDEDSFLLCILIISSYRSIYTFGEGIVHMCDVYMSGDGHDIYTIHIFLA